MGSNSVKASNDFSSKTTGQILMTLGHNDHLVLEIYLYLKQVLPHPTTQGAERQSQMRGLGLGQIESNNVLISNVFSSETTHQILMKLGHNDHLVVEIGIYT